MKLLMTDMPAAAAEIVLVSQGGVRVVTLDGTVLFGPYPLPGGGTGGHLYPALTIGEALHEGAPGKSVELLFIGARKGLEARVLADRPLNAALISAWKALRSASLTVPSWSVSSALNNAGASVIKILSSCPLCIIVASV